MKRLLQGTLLRLYARAQAMGLLSTSPGRFAFDRAYGLYKEWLEAATVDHLEALVAPGSTVVDIGANIGFFTQRFARWTGPEGRVLALEPELENFRRLSISLAKNRQTGWVETIQAAAGESTGIARLHLNPLHPGDHRLAGTSDQHGVNVQLVRLDDVLAARGWPKVSLVKIDVQGAEERVLLGAERTLASIRPAWFVEVADDLLRAMGSSAEALLNRFVAQRYAIRRFDRNGIGAPLDPMHVLRTLRPGDYEDLLFTP